MNINNKKIILLFTLLFFSILTKISFALEKNEITITNNPNTEELEQKISQIKNSGKNAKFIDNTLNEIASELDFIFEDILNYNYQDKEDKIKALYIKKELMDCYEYLENAPKKNPMLLGIQHWRTTTRFLICLFEWQKIADSKLMIWKAITSNNKDFDIPSKARIQKIRLDIFNKLFKRMLSSCKRVLNSMMLKPYSSSKLKYKAKNVIYTNLQEKPINNKQITNLVLEFIPKKLKSSYKEIFSVDFYQLWNKLHSEYSSVLGLYKKYSNNLDLLDSSKVDKVFSLIREQKDILTNLDLASNQNLFLKLITKFVNKTYKNKIPELDVYIVGSENEHIVLEENQLNSMRKNMEAQFKNSIELFDLLMLKLISIKNEIDETKQIKKLAENFANFDTKKKNILLLHSSLIKSEGFINLQIKNNLGEKYKELVEEFLISTENKLKDNLFVYKGLTLITDLQILKKQNSSLLKMLGLGISSIENSVMNDMIENLKIIFVNKENNSGFFEKVLVSLVNKFLNGEIESSKLIEKLKGFAS